MNITTKTKLASNDANPVTTAVTIDWSNASEDDIKALAARTIVIAAQSQWRKDGSIPAEITLDAHEFANPTRAPRKPADLKAMLAKLSPEDRAALLAQFA
jgi:DNA-directed RNA polymerase specialized sigma24 family protein